MAAADQKPAKRPWYLMVALIAAWIFGAGAIGDGWFTIAFYKSEHLDLTLPARSIADDADRAKVVELTEHYVALMDAERGKMLPFGVAKLVLGLAMWALAVAALGGRGGARSALVQIIAVYGAVALVGYWFTRDVPRAAVDIELAQHLAEMKETQADKAAVDTFAELSGSTFRVVVPPAQALVRALASALIVLALTRQRSRAYFETGARPG